MQLTTDMLSDIHVRQVVYHLTIPDNLVTAVLVCRLFWQVTVKLQLAIDPVGPKGFTQLVISTLQGYPERASSTLKGILRRASVRQ